MKYVFGSGLVAAVSAGYALLKGTKDAPITWRAVVAWLSWAITLVIAVGNIVDLRKDERGIALAPESPLVKKQNKAALKFAKEFQKHQRNAAV